MGSDCNAVPAQRLAVTDSYGESPKNILTDPKNSTIYLPTQLLLHKQIPVTQDEVVKAIKEPPTPLREIIKFAFEQFNDGRKKVILLFEDNVNDDQECKWTFAVAPVVSACLRELSEGTIFCVDPDQNYLLFNTEPYFFVKSKEQISDLLCQQYENKFIEFVYSPLNILYEEIKQLLKHFDSLKQQLEAETKSKFGALRKLADFRSFSVMIVVFSMDNIEDALKYNKNFFSSLMFNEQLIAGRDLIEKGAKKYETEFELESPMSRLCLGIFTLVMSLENEQFREYELQQKRVLALDYILVMVKADESYAEKCNGMYQYLMDCLPEIYKKQVDELYQTKKETKEAAIPQEIVDSIVENAIQVYVFSNSNKIDVSLEEYDKQVVAKGLKTIVMQIQEELLGADKCVFGCSLDGNPFISILREEQKLKSFAGSIGDLL